MLSLNSSCDIFKELAIVAVPRLQCFTNANTFQQKLQPGALPHTPNKAPHANANKIVGAGVKCINIRGCFINKFTMKNHIMDVTLPI
jgi:hypothetical protein